MDTLSRILGEIVMTAEKKTLERCPYKTVEEQCTFRGECQNQQREQDRTRCASDEAIFAPNRGPACGRSLP